MRFLELPLESENSNVILEHSSGSDGEEPSGPVLMQVVLSIVTYLGLSAKEKSVSWFADQVSISEMDSC